MPSVIALSTADRGTQARYGSTLRSRRASAPSGRSLRCISRALAGIAAVRAARPGLPTVACFDTAFHAGLPAAAATYALPAAWVERHGLRRFGFHGLSHAHVARRANVLVGRVGLKVVSCHLGAGASLAAIHDGRSVDTTMGSTPLEGLVMATRSDPWILACSSGCCAKVASRPLSSRLASSTIRLLGLSGTADMRLLLERDDDRARLALAVYAHRLRQRSPRWLRDRGHGRAGVHGGRRGTAPQVRSAAAAGLEFLGVVLDEARNTAAVPDADVGAPGAAVRVLAVETREDAEIARQVTDVIG